MTKEEMMREINSLPREAQREIEDLVSVLRERYKNPQSTVPTFDRECEAFVGMWGDREDMRDSSSAWARNIRETHWVK